MLRQNRLSRINIVTTTKPGRTPGRPRQFDAEQAIETAQRLFHARGYDAVSVADLTHAFGINPRAFMLLSATSSGCIPASLQRYSQTGAIPIDALLRDDQPVAASLIAVLQEAARRYVADPAAAGCGAGGVHCQDADARVAAGEWHAAARAKIQQYIARHRPQDALRVTDYMDTLMLGLSAKAREGDSLPRLLETVRLAGLALERILPA